MTDTEKDIINLIERYGMIGGAHHKQWLLDQIVRSIKEDEYDEWIKNYNEDEIDSKGYEDWDTGIAP